MLTHAVTVKAEVVLLCYIEAGLVMLTHAVTVTSGVCWCFHRQSDVHL